MMKLKKFLLPCITLFASICLSDEIDYSQFTSHQELIAFETAAIASFSDSEPNMLAHAYMDRAESLIVAEEANNSTDDLKKGLYYASFCQKKSEKTFYYVEGFLISASPMGLQKE